MSGNSNSTDAPGWDTALVMLTKARTIIQQNAARIDRRNRLLREEHDATESLGDLKKAVNRVNRIKKDVEINLEDKKRYALESYTEAIREASLIVPDSNLAGIGLKVEGGRALIVNPEGQDINEREGSACRSVMGQLMRHTTLMQEPGALPMVLLDETFFTLSDNTCNEMQSYLQEMSKDLLIIAIEQKDTLFQGIEDKRRFEFIKTGEGLDACTKIKEDA